LEEEALNRHIWRTRCGRGYRPVATQTTHVKSFRSDVSICLP